MRDRSALKIVLLSVLLAVACVWSVTSGPVRVPFDGIWSPAYRTIVALRLMRVAMGILVGMGLAVSGLVLQAILRNPLAEPYLLGTSSGAGLGAVIALALGLSHALVPGAAFAGALLSTMLVYALARSTSRMPHESLILTGVVVSFACSAVIVFILSFSGNDALFGVTRWLWGNLQVYDVRSLAGIAAAVAVSIAAISVFAQDLNALSVGEEDAVHLGVDVERVKRIMLVLTSLITAVLVSLCGIIGFVGLMVPHMVRMVVGPNHRVLIPATCLGAASFVLVCDVLARTVCAPVEVPLGTVTALLGAPLCLVLMQRARRVP